MKVAMLRTLMMAGRDMCRDMDTIQTSHSYDHLVGFYGNSRNEEFHGQNRSWEMNMGSYRGYGDPNYSITGSNGLYKQLDQMATMMRSQQEAISKFL